MTTHAFFIPPDVAINKEMIHVAAADSVLYTSIIQDRVSGPRTPRANATLRYGPRRHHQILFCLASRSVFRQGVFFGRRGESRSLATRLMGFLVSGFSRGFWSGFRTVLSPPGKVCLNECYGLVMRRNVITFLSRKKY